MPTIPEGLIPADEWHKKQEPIDQQTYGQCFVCKCHGPVVLESRCTGGESHSLYPSYSYSDVQVCRDRLQCRRNIAEREESRVMSRQCRICGHRVVFRKSTEQELSIAHLDSHSKEDLTRFIWNSHQCVFDLARYDA